MRQQIGPSPSPSGEVIAVVTDPGWSWEATATIIQAVATIVALGGVAVTFFFSYRAERRERLRAQAEAARGREDAERADAAAERSERAAALSIDTMGRIAEAVEAVAAKDFGATTLIPVEPPAKVRWSLRHSKGDTYLLTNIGNATAHAATVAADQSLILNKPPTGVTVNPGEGVTFMALAHGGTVDRTITVTWASSEAEDAPRESWRYPLPPRPPRR